MVKELIMSNVSRIELNLGSFKLQCFCMELACNSLPPIYLEKPLGHSGKATGLVSLGSIPSFSSVSDKTLISPISI